MTTHVLTQAPTSQTAMSIRRPVADVFEAFVNPEITTRFWFSKSSGRLAVGHQVQWQWEAYDIVITINVLEIEANKRILIEWPAQQGLNTVEWTFTQSEHGTFVRITESGFSGDSDALLNQITGSVQGFTLVLAGLKALLEHDIELNLVADRYPGGVEKH